MFDSPSSFSSTPSSSSSTPSSQSSTGHWFTLSPIAAPSHSQPHSANTTATPRQRLEQYTVDTNDVQQAAHETAEWDGPDYQRQQPPRQHAAHNHSHYPYPNPDGTGEYSARRVKHRQIDAVRRAREQSAISRLQQLTQRLTHIAHFDQHYPTPTSRRKAPEWKKDKVSVLEEAADRMDALYGLIEQLGAACTSQYEQSRSKAYQHKSFSTLDGDVNDDSHMLSLLLSHSARSAPLSTRTHHSAHAHSLLDDSQPRLREVASAANDARNSLYSTFFLSASLPMLTVRCETGAVIDVNSAALALSGWQPHHMIGKRVTAPYDLIMSTPNKSVAEIDAEEAALCSNGSARVMVEGKESDGRMVNATEHTQYEASNELERKLYGGELSVIQAVWRLQLRNGRLHEMTVTQWCGEWDEVPDGGGGTRRQPTYMVYVISPESIVRVD